MSSIPMEHHAVETIKRRTGAQPGRYTNHRGYVMVLNPNRFTGGRKYIQEHTLIVEQAIGHELPPQAEVHHFNEIKDDNHNHNLVACEDHLYHELLHHRTAILQLGGDPDLHNWCTSCHNLLSVSEFYRSTTRISGYANKCKLCEVKLRRIASLRRELHCVACGNTFVSPSKRQTCGEKCFKRWLANASTQHGFHEILLKTLTTNPNSTSLELSRAASVERHIASARLPELELRGLVVRGGKRHCSVSGKPAVTWRKI